MSTILSLFTQVLHIGLIIVTAPTVAGLIDWLDAKLIGRSGPPVFLPWRDLVRLSRKTPMKMESVSVVLRWALPISLGATLCAAALVPSFTLGMALSPLSDVLVVVTLLTVARVAVVLAALDTGAPRPGLAAQNASALAVLAEPALMLSVLTLGLMGGSFNLELIISQQRDGLLLPAAASAVVLTALLALGFADTTTSAGGLDQLLSGSELASSKITAWMRRLIWLNLIGGTFLPVGMASTDNGPLDWLFGLGCWVVRLMVLILVLCGVQTFLGRVPRHSLSDLIGIATLLALLAMIIVMAGIGMA